MTSHRYTRCAHCSVIFVYQSSGAKVDGYSNQSDSDTYCRDCWTVITAALAAVPVRCTKFFETVTDPKELEGVFAKAQDLKDNPPRLFGATGPIMRELGGGGLFKLDPITRNIVATRSSTVVRFDFKYYTIDTWSDGREPVQVQRAMERDLVTNTTQPWLEYR